jgi:2-dehydro-3-deoxyphosphogluconate aldolase/(4S)-4-hydroxy-2-oxoglutarate aldolase
VTCLEVTWTTPGAAGIVRRIADAGIGVPGAGSIRTVAQAEEAVRAGARYLVSPALVAPVAEWATGKGIAHLPGALTPNEILAAWAAGGRPVKVFPCGALGGPAYLKSVLAPLPDLELVPTGGVSLENMKSYLDAGAKAVGLGESFTRGDPADLVSRARDAVARAAR